jgi:hypothetical protein
MNRINTMKTVLKPLAAAVALALGAGPAFAEVYELCVGPTTKALPDGTSVPVWGYALGGATNGVCTTTPTLPGPRLTVTDGTLTVNLTNTLSEPTSIVVTGLGMPAGSSPTWNDGTTGPRANTDQRVRSFGLEAPAGGSQSYTFNVDRPGSFVYHSGTLPQKQVYMGLYGAVTQDAVAGTEAYPGVAYANEEILFYSDLDPAHNAAVVGTGLATAIHYDARWFLINGEPYVDGVTPDIAGVAADQPTLLRFFSAASETHVPVLQGRHMTIHAEDALPYTWQDGVTGVRTPAPREQWSVMLSPLKTADAIITPTSETRFAIYDGNGYMTNPSDINDYDVGDTVGGMLRFVSVGPAVVNAAPSVDAVVDQANQDGETIAGLQIVASDSDGDTLSYSATGLPPSLTIDSVSGVISGTTANDASSASPYAVTVNVSDGTDITSVAFAWNVTNPVPVVTTPTDQTSQDGETIAGVQIEASDPDGDTLSYSATGLPPSLTIDSVSGLISGTIDANASTGSPYSVTVNVSDGTDTTSVSFSWAINPVVANTPPDVTPIADQTSAEGDSVSLQVTATDGDGDTLSYSATGLPLDLTIAPATGLISGTVAAGASASSPYSVTVSVSDGSATTDVTFAWTVTAVVAPTDTLYFSTSGNSLPPGAGGTADDADIYRWDGTAFSRVVDASTIGVPGGANVDGMVFVSSTDFYLSFTDNRSLPVIGTVQDEDIVRYNNGAWSVFFDGTARNLTSGGQDIDAFDIVNGTIYFSTQGNTNPTGVTGTADDADIYAWNGTAFSRVVDATTIGVPGGANVDALKFVNATEFYLSFTGDITLPGLSTVQDEDVVKYTNGTWSVYFDGTAKGLTAGGHDIDAMQLP